ncbi:thermonuclease family protein [Candidatus Vondammii sp. HM_W22]|uniref:thermonuclease family protein n=1 Tax=Candidatus Vondammii sp. HM_W22 TaxID=2687299 RepID=UPI001F141B21|nr:thermonuclease family protein [Candidatus Vondammii sp. HM_W22]
MRGQCEREIKLARRAKKHTVAFLLSGGRVELRNIKRGKYFRIVADVYVDGKSLTKSLLNAGLGYPYGGKKKKTWC